MTEAEKLIVKEALKLADDALGQLTQVQNPTVAHIAGLLKVAIEFGETLT